MSTLINREEIEEANQRVKNGPLTIHHTPCIEVFNPSKGLGLIKPSSGDTPFSLYLKLENMQTTRSFKIRGVSNQFQSVGVGQAENQPTTFVTMSAGIIFCALY